MRRWRNQPMGKTVSKKVDSFLTLILFYSIDGCKKLQVLFIRSNMLSDFDLECITKSLKTNTVLKVIDISSNQTLSQSEITKFFDVLQSNRSIEYFGLAKLGLTTQNIQPLFSLIGKFPFPEDQVESHKIALKNRDAIVEKNKKLKASKKPEEPVPVLDEIT